MERKINSIGHLEIGEMDSVALAETYGTPLYVLDLDYVEMQINKFKTAFSSEKFETRVLYASKSFLCKGICQFLKNRGMSLDVVSGGELYTALQADFPRERICFHGNNKTDRELIEALEAGVGLIVVDNSLEYERLKVIARRRGQRVNVLLRVNPGIDAHTHEYIQTAKHDSKFGESIFAESTMKLIESMSNDDFVNLRGFHCHIGSQIFEGTSFEKAAEAMIEYVCEVRLKTGFEATHLNLGGGFGIYYAEGDKPLEIETTIPRMVESVERTIEEKGLNLEVLMIEPGRSLVANAGTTLYTVGGTKKTYGGKKYVFVDGGMTDNPRPALYQAVYEGIIANRANEEASDIVTVAGKCCESGDILIKDGRFARAERGDILAVFGTGAYNYSMASRYNRHGIPAVVGIKNGKSQLLVKRESYEDLTRLDQEFEE
ncbi:MAG: diaminopimelate decarboxylase [Tissierellales bacterium]|jgi:diaminopimelate decarboxylase|nr:diaminopimelate decarboxylase [Tissierellales bacterium]